MFGYATNETPELMPMPIVLAHKLARRLAQVRREGLLPYLRPDGKTQVTVRYDADGRPAGVEKVLISTQHEDGVEAKLPDALWEQVVTQALPPDLYDAGGAAQGVLRQPDRPVRDRRTGRRHRPDRPQDHRGHLRRVRQARRRRLLRQGPLQGGPVRLLRGAACGQEHRGRRARRPGRGPGGLRDRGRPAAVPAHRDLRHREESTEPRSRAWSATTSTCGPPPWWRRWTCAGRSTGRPPPTVTSAATNPASPGRTPTRPPPSAPRPASAESRVGPAPSARPPPESVRPPHTPATGTRLVAGTPNPAGVFGRRVIVRRDRPWESPH